MVVVLLAFLSLPMPSMESRFNTIFTATFCLSGPNRAAHFGLLSGCAYVRPPVGLSTPRMPTTSSSPENLVGI